LFAEVLGADTSKSPPRRTSPFHYYIKVYYPSRVKEEHERRYTVAKKKYEDATEDERKSQEMEVPVRVAMMTSICGEFWRLESEEFRDGVAQEAEEVYQKDLEQWEALQRAPKTPQQFHQ